MVVREGRKLRFHYHSTCFKNEGGPRSLKESTFFHQNRYGKIQVEAPVIKGFGKWSVELWL